MADINGPPMLRCELCREEYSDYEDSLVKLCPDCCEEVENGEVECLGDDE